MSILNNTPYNTGDVVSMKLVNGEELVGKFESATLGNWIFTSPFMVIPGEKGVALAPAMIGTDPKTTQININTNTICYHTLSRPELAAHYGQVATNLITPQKTLME